MALEYMTNAETTARARYVDRLMCRSCRVSHMSGLTLLGRGSLTLLLRPERPNDGSNALVIRQAVLEVEKGVGDRLGQAFDCP